MGIGLEHELRTVLLAGRHDSDPAISPDREILPLGEAEHLRVEPQRLVLVVDEMLASWSLIGLPPSGRAVASARRSAQAVPC